jgi:hypothetical protein
MNDGNHYHEENGLLAISSLLPQDPHLLLTGSSSELKQLYL